MFVFPPALFPSVGYMSVWTECECAWNIESRYEKRSLRNRYRIYGPNGAQNLTAQIDHSSDKSVFGNVKLEHRHHWVEKEWRSIETAYRNSSFFDALAADLEPIVLKPHLSLIDRCTEIMEWTCMMLRISPVISLSTVEVSHEEIVHPGFEYTALPYRQVFDQKSGFIPGLSTLDLLMNEGPLAADILKQQSRTVLPLLQRNTK